MLADLHTHALPASSDARARVEALADEAASLGLEALALTDHGPADLAAANDALAARGVAMIPGREVSTDLGHVLVLATDLEWLAGLPPRCPLPLPDSRRGPCALIWAHPAGWRTGGALIPPDPSRGAAHLHGVEVLNGERIRVEGATDPASFIEGLAAGDAEPVLSRRWAEARGYDYRRSDLVPYLR